MLSAVLRCIYDGRTCVYVSLPSGERIPATDVHYDKQTDNIVIDTAKQKEVHVTINKKGHQVS